MSETIIEMNDTVEVEKRKLAAAGLEAFLVRHRLKFGYIHLGMFIMFAALFAVPPFLPHPPEEATFWNNYTLFVKFAVWGVWFPLLFLSTIVLGRAWCGIFCPQGALSEFASKRGQNRPIPGWMRWEGTPILSFVAITIFGQLVGVRDYPRPMLLVFGGTMVLTTWVGYRYTRGRRAWCRHLCPVGLLLGILSRLGMVGIEKGERNGSRAACPTYINLSTKTASRHCIECMRCVNPVVPGSLRLNVRKPGSEIAEVEKREPELSEVLFLFLATGLTLGSFHWLVNPVFVRFKTAVGDAMFSLGLGGFAGSSGPWFLMVNYPEAADVFIWVDVVSITLFMLLFMLAVGGSLLALSICAGALLRRDGKPVLERAAVVGYAFAPVALMSLVLGLGVEMFSLMGQAGLGAGTVKGLKLAGLAAGALWSLYLGAKLTAGSFLARLPMAAGVAVVAWAWFTAV